MGKLTHNSNLMGWELGLINWEILEKENLKMEKKKELKDLLILTGEIQNKN